MNCSAVSDEAMSRVRHHLDRYIADRRTVADVDVASALRPDEQELAKALQENGFMVEELPLGDYRIDIQFDLMKRKSE